MLTLTEGGTVLLVLVGWYQKKSSRTGTYFRSAAFMGDNSFD